MKLAWLCYPYSYGDDGELEEVPPVLETTKPYKHKYKKVIAVVYAKLEEEE
jgi:hypothetical protein